MSPQEFADLEKQAQIDHANRALAHAGNAALSAELAWRNALSAWRGLDDRVVRLAQAAVAIRDVVDWLKTMPEAQWQDTTHKTQDIPDSVPQDSTVNTQDSPNV